MRASDNPIAIACSRLLTLPPLPDLPLRRVPFLRRRIALSTLLLAPLLYFLRLDLRDERFLVGIEPLREEGWSKGNPHVRRSETRRSAPGSGESLFRSSPPSNAPRPVATKVYPASITTPTNQSSLFSGLVITR